MKGLKHQKELVMTIMNCYAMTIMNHEDVDVILSSDF